MDHSAILYLMDANGRFVGVIPYQENTAKAVPQLKKLAAQAPSW
jgi:cytochrome oxidase Cu insertion factor (SCO1/SenC/PrrC family)